MALAPPDGQFGPAGTESRRRFAAESKSAAMPVRELGCATDMRELVLGQRDPGSSTLASRRPQGKAFQSAMLVH